MSSRSRLLSGCAALAGAVLGAVPAAHAVVTLQPSPYLASIPDPACDLVVTPANAATTFYQLNNPAYRVICVDPGDYRPYGGNTLNASGSAAAPRYLRFNGPGSVKAFERTSQALFERLDVRGSWWVVQGLTFQPLSSGTVWIVSLTGADHVVVDGNLIDAIQHPNGPYQAGVLIEGLSGDPATDDTIQRNVVRNGDQSHQAGDYSGIAIAVGYVAGEDNDRNEILDNEVADWGDGIALNGWSSACDEPGHQHATVIDGNDVYVTPAKYVDCTTGAASPTGQCACAENGIDVKANPGADPALWTRITRNRVWGFRPTTEAVVCGGSGAIGQAITAGNDCPGHVLVARNAIADSTIGIDVGGSSWILAGNLIHDIQPSDGHIYGSLALLLGTQASDLAIQWNTIVDSMNAYDDRSSDTDTRCNVVINSPEWIGVGQPRGLDHTTEYNHLFASGWSNLVGPTNRIYSNVAESGNQTLCYERRRWTGPEQVCVPYGGLGPTSPQRAAAPYCDAGIAAAFGMPPIGYPANQPAPGNCGLGAEVALALGALHRAARRRERERAPRQVERGPRARSFSENAPAPCATRRAPHHAFS